MRMGESVVMRKLTISAVRFGNCLASKFIMIDSANLLVRWKHDRAQLFNPYRKDY